MKLGADPSSHQWMAGRGMSDERDGEGQPSLAEEGNDSSIWTGEN